MSRIDAFIAGTRAFLEVLSTPAEEIHLDRLDSDRLLRPVENPVIPEPQRWEQIDKVDVVITGEGWSEISSPESEDETPRG